MWRRHINSFSISLFGLIVLTIASCHIEARATAEHNDYANDEQDELVSEEEAIGTASPGAYDPHARDFTARCMKLAKYSGEKACEVFMECCAEDNVLNKLNGDRCQRADSHNGCTLKQTGGIMWSLCRAYNCTAEITTTTSTTTIMPKNGSTTLYFSTRLVSVYVSTDPEMEI